MKKKCKLDSLLQKIITTIHNKIHNNLIKSLPNIINPESSCDASITAEKHLERLKKEK